MLWRTSWSLKISFIFGLCNGWCRVWIEFPTRVPSNCVLAPGWILKWFSFHIYTLHFAVYNAHPCFWPKFSGKKSFILIFNSIICLFIFRYLFFALYSNFSIYFCTYYGTRNIMQQITTKHKNRYKVFQVLPMYNAHPYFSLEYSGKKLHITHGKIWWLALVMKTVQKSDA